LGKNGSGPNSIGMTETERNHYLDAAVAAAHAGAVELESWRARFQVREKARADLVTDADHASQAAVKATLLGQFPGLFFLGEEECVGKAPHEVRPAPGAPPTWVVDPLDGTSNYVHDVPAYCVSIGLVINGSIEVGVIFDPRQNELFAASLGRGAFLNGRPIRVSPTATVRDSLLSTGFPTGWAQQQRNLAAWYKVSEHSQALRRTGSTALNLAYVAAGRFDGYWAYDNYPWDLAAGALLVTEAGGILAAADGTPFDCFRPDCVATNGKIQPELLGILAK
jgi:myo-inositol-1(or 4)-monophosphatase